MLTNEEYQLLLQALKKSYIYLLQHDTHEEVLRSIREAEQQLINTFILETPLKYE
jgi:hypothetical protein